MYAKLKSGAVSYDVVIPSDYMIARMEAEDMLLPLNYDNIPNYQYISEDFRGLYYDPDDTYTVPYTYGIVGVIYNANVVDEADTGSWDLMWNPKYASNILQFNNARDALGTAMYRAKHRRQHDRPRRLAAGTAGTRRPAPARQELRHG